MKPANDGETRAKLHSGGGRRLWYHPAQPDTCNKRPDMSLVNKLVDQIIEHAEKGLGKPRELFLTHDEIDGWRNQFDGTPIPVSLLCFRGIPIREIEMPAETN